MLSPAVLSKWSRFASATPKRFGTGLINDTFLLENGEEKAIFQGLHPAFRGIVNQDIHALTLHLKREGMLTPEILPTDEGALWVDDEDGRPWRALTFVNGRSVDKIESPARAREAGKLVGRFHGALTTFEHDYAFTRPGVHDSTAHLAKLDAALRQNANHPLFAEVSALASVVAPALTKLAQFDPTPLRHVHGDLKISNLLFDDAGKGMCLVDLDTVARMQLVHELGDAFRSWTNPAGEDVASPVVDIALYESAVEGYAETAHRPTTAELQTLPRGLALIAAELATRFLTDALEERYFGWNSQRYATRGEHNLVRARGQWSLANSAVDEAPRLEKIIARAFR